jgi:hypothetical protein
VVYVEGGSGACSVSGVHAREDAHGHRLKHPHQQTTRAHTERVSLVSVPSAMQRILADARPI